MSRERGKKKRNHAGPSILPLIDGESDEDEEPRPSLTLQSGLVGYVSDDEEDESNKKKKRIAKVRRPQRTDSQVELAIDLQQAADDDDELIPISQTLPSATHLTLMRLLPPEPPGVPDPALQVHLCLRALLHVRGRLNWKSS